MLFTPRIWRSLTARSRERRADRRGRRPRAPSSARATSPAPRHAPRPARAPSARHRRRRARDRATRTSAPRACAARRGSARPAPRAGRSGAARRAGTRAGARPPPTPAERPRPSSLGQRRRSAAALRPERVELRDDPLAEEVARPRESERRVRVQALEAAAAARAADAEVERGAAVLRRGVRARRELVAQTALLGVGRRQTRRQLGIGADGVAPALDAAGGLEARDRRDEMAARD